MAKLNGTIDVLKGNGIFEIFHAGRLLGRQGKIKAAGYYVKAVMEIRAFFLMIFFLMICLFLLTGGLVVFSIASLLYFPASMPIRTILAATAVIFYIILPLCGIGFLLSQRTWARFFKIQEILKKTTANE